MKLKDAYLCPDCDEVFSITGHCPTCPVCANSHNLSLYKVLNRQEGKNETDNRYIVSASGHIPVGRIVVTNAPGIGDDGKEEPAPGGGDQGRDRRSGRKGPKRDFDGKQANGCQRAVSTLIDVFGILFSEQGRIRKELSGIDADTAKDPLGGREHIDRRQDIPGEA
jgi:hypothetical protein